MHKHGAWPPAYPAVAGLPTVRCQISRPVANQSGPFARPCQRSSPKPPRQARPRHDSPHSAQHEHAVGARCRSGVIGPNKLARSPLQTGHSPPWTAAGSLIVCHSIRPTQVLATTPGRLIWHRTPTVRRALDNRAPTRRSERRPDVSIYVSPASRTGYPVRLRGRWACRACRGSLALALARESVQGGTGAR